MASQLRRIGSAGFVAVVEADGARLRWLAYFERSNPFLHVRLESDGQEVVARSTYGSASVRIEEHREPR